MKTKQLPPPAAKEPLDPPAARAMRILIDRLIEHCRRDRRKEQADDRDG